MENKYNPEKHHRRSIRLKGYDYSQAGAYFITICTQNRENLFGEIISGEMVLNEIGNIVNKFWYEIPEHFPNVELDEFVVMPNHLHGIIVICNNDGNNCRGEANASPKPKGEANASPKPKGEANASPLQIQPQTQQQKPCGTKSGSLGAIIQNFKSFSTRKINEICKTPSNKIWQRNYYEHIIRNENELNRIREYIINNPLKWESDENNPKNAKM